MCFACKSNSQTSSLHLCCMLVILQQTAAVLQPHLLRHQLCALCGHAGGVRRWCQKRLLQSTGYRRCRCGFSEAAVQVSSSDGPRSSPVCGVQLNMCLAGILLTLVHAGSPAGQQTGARSPRQCCRLQDSPQCIWCPFPSQLSTGRSTASRLCRSPTACKAAWNHC